MTESSASAQLRITIKTLVKQRRLTYGQIGAGLGVSEATVKRILNQDDISFGRLEQLAQFFDMDVFELVALAKGAEVVGAELTEEQETCLGADGALAHVFWMFLRGLTPAQIMLRKALPARAMNAYLRTLESAGLVRRQVNGRVRAELRWPLHFRQGGFLQETFAYEILKEFLQRLMKKADQATRMKAKDWGFSLWFEEFLLPEAAYAALRRDLRDLRAKYLQESRMYMAGGMAAASEPVSLMVGIDRFDAYGPVFDPS